MGILVLEIEVNSSAFLIQGLLFYGFLENSVRLVIILTMDTIGMNAEKEMIAKFLEGKDRLDMDMDQYLEI